MQREQIIKELSKHAHPSWFKKLLTWPTGALKTLLEHFETEEEVEVLIARKSGEPLKRVMKFNGRIKK